ncbi:MAG: DUF3592 domain-containing protein [Bacteroidales bacterium]|nr:DUF3592 domain-containing protein [Bacteroidales bacterium]
MSNKQGSSITSLIVGAAFIVSAWLLYTHISAPMAEEAKASELWPNVPGIITYSDIDESLDDGKTIYAAAINYDFTVENKSYSGNRISLTSGNTRTSSLREVKKDLQKYPVGANVTVYYDPELPNNAVLEPGADFFTYIIKYAPFLLGFFGILMLIRIFRKVAILALALFAGSRN